MLVPRHNPPTEYPVVLIQVDYGQNVFVPDFNRMIFNTDLGLVKKFIDHELRRRRDLNEFHPYASSLASVVKMHPDHRVTTIPTEGWDILGALEPPSPEEE